MLYPFAAAASVATDVRALMFIYLFFGNFANIESRRATRQESRLCQMPTLKRSKSVPSTSKNGTPFSFKRKSWRTLLANCRLQKSCVYIKKG